MQQIAQRGSGQQPQNQPYPTHTKPRCSLPLFPRSSTNQIPMNTPNQLAKTRISPGERPKTRRSVWYMKAMHNPLQFWWTIRCGGSARSYSLVSDCVLYYSCFAIL